MNTPLEEAGQLQREQPSHEEWSRQAGMAQGDLCGTGIFRPFSHKLRPDRDSQ